MNLKDKSVADVAGAWVDAACETGLIRRCKEHWNTPVSALPDIMLATYLNQRIATDLVAEEARRRIASGMTDGSELYDGQLAEALSQIDRTSG